MILGKAFQQRVKELISDPAFDKPIANLKIDYTTRGSIILVTKIKPKPNYDKSI